MSLPSFSVEPRRGKESEVVRSCLHSRMSAQPALSWIMLGTALDMDHAMECELANFT
jgi:hypothetical protein